MLRRRRALRGPIPSLVVQDEVAASTDRVVERLHAMHQTSLARVYADGLTDGVKIALTLLLGQTSEGGQPYTGPQLPPEAVEWAEAALARARQDRP